MLVGRGVALGLGGMNLTDLSKRFSTCSAPSSGQYCLGEHNRASPTGGLVEALTAASLSGILRSGPTAVNPAKPVSSMAGGKRQQKQEEQEKKKKVVIKKSFNRSTFWAACRATVFGTVLILLGAAMCTIGYYREYFAMENVMVAENVTAIAPNPTKKVQYHSLAFIGPVVMGAGAFVLMMTCVTTLESRDRQARIYQQQQAELDCERTPLSRQGTGSKKGAPIADSVGPKAPALKSPPPPPPPAPQATPDPARSQQSGVDRQKSIRSTKSAYQTAELVAVPNQKGCAGVVNKCFTRDDSKTTSKPDTDSGPSGTTTTTLTWSKNGGPRCETDSVPKFPSTSCIDNLAKKPDERALLQRFLEDQSRLVEDRLNRRIRLQQQQKQKQFQLDGDDDYKSASFDAAGSEKMSHSCSRNYGSEEMAPRRNVVAAEVHHAVDASPLPKRVSTTGTPAPTPAPVSAPIISPNALELFSPSSDSAHSFGQHKPTPTPSPLLIPPHISPRSASGSYVTVHDPEEPVDIVNANIFTQTSAPRGYNTFTNSQNTPPRPDSGGSESGARKLYDSIFLVEKLRQEQATMGGISKKAPYLAMGSNEQTGVLCKNWQEMNANYLKDQQHST